MTAVNEVAAAIGTAPACDALGLPRASWYRAHQPAAAARPRPTPPRALDPGERQGVLDLLHTRFVDQPPAQVHATLLDEGTYLCSPRTMYRLLDDAHEIKERRDQVRRPHYAAPELLATRPNEVWSWPRWKRFHRYSFGSSRLRNILVKILREEVSVAQRRPFWNSANWHCGHCQFKECSCRTTTTCR